MSLAFHKTEIGFSVWVLSNHHIFLWFQFSSVQSLSRVWLFATPWIAARQAPLSITNQLPEFIQTHAHRVGDAIQPSHPLFYGLFVYKICIYLWIFLFSYITQLPVTLCDSMDCSPPGSFVHEIFQARILEWVVFSYSMYLYIDLYLYIYCCRYESKGYATSRCCSNCNLEVGQLWCL